MFRILSVMESARKITARRNRRVSQWAYLYRQSLRGGNLAGPRLEELEDRRMLTMLGQSLFPADYPWNQNIANAPVASNSAAIISHIGDSVKIHPDWGDDSASNGSSPLYGIPYNVVHGNTTAKINVSIDNYPGESDIVPVPIPANAVIEGDYQNGPNPNGGGYNDGQRGDSHLLVWDEDTDTAYELYGVTRPSDTMLFPNTDGVEEPHTDGLWHAAQESVWHMSADDFRALGDTSADAAGLSILAGLARPDEGLPTSQGGQGAIDHALRFTLPSGDVDSQYIYPASHVVDESSGSTKLPLGARLRLANTTAIDNLINTMGPEAKDIATAMQQYGLVLADIGSSMYVTGTSASQDANNNIDLTWDMDDVLGLGGLTASDFQVLNLTPVVTGLSATSGSAGNTITINGQDFSGAAGQLSVLFGTTAATNVTYISDSQITAVVPSGTGTEDVTVQSGVNETDPNKASDNVNNPIFGYGTSATTTADQFTFSQSSTTPPSLTPGGGTAGFTAGGPAVAIDNGLTITPGNTDTSLTGATVTLNSPLSGDTLNFTAQNNISVVSNTGGVLTLGGSSSVANYQAALRSVTFSNSTNTTVSNRTFSIQADDSAASPVGSNSLPETVDVFAPVKVSALYVKASGWLSGFNSYLSTHSLGNAATPSLGYALQTGTAQKTDLPWTTMNTIEATFSGAVNVTASSLILSGGTGGSTPTVTGFSSLGNNTYSWTLTSLTFLTNNRYEISFQASGANAVTDTRGAGLDGDWTNGTSTFSSGDGNGLAGGNFNFLLNVTPGDADQSSLVNANDYIKVRAKLGLSTSSTAYTPYYDVDGNGLLNANDYITVRGKLGTFLPANSPAPQTAQVGGLQTDDSLTQLALGVQEGSTASTGSSSTGSSVANVISTPVGTSVASTSSSTGSADAGSGGGSSSTLLASTDAAVEEFDVTDLWV